MLAGTKVDQEWFDTLVDAVGLADRLTHRPAELSGGQQQRVAIARALISRPAVVFADEPTGNLDSKSAREVLDLLRRAVDEFGQTVIMVTHDAGAAAAADRVVRAARRQRRPRRRRRVRRGAARPHEAGRLVMTRMALRGLFARKLRTALTGFAVVIGVAFVAGTFIFTDTINASFNDLFERVSKGVDVSVTAKQPVEGDFGGRIQPLPHGTLEKVEPAPGVEAAEGASRPRWRSSTRTASAIGGNGPPSILFSTSEERFDPLTYVDGGPADDAGEVTLDKATADRARLRGRRQAPGRRPRARARSTRSSASPSSATRTRSASASMTMPLEEVQRIAAAAGASHRGRGRGRRRHVARGAQGVDQPRARRHRRRAHRQGAGREVGRRHQRLARLPHDRAARVRRRRRARGRLPDLQHVRGHRRAALEGVRAAAHARRVAPPGAQRRSSSRRS